MEHEPTNSDPEGSDRPAALPQSEPVAIGPPDGILLVLTTVGSRDEADEIAQALVEERLAACVNVVADCSSTYRWQGAVEQAEETMLLIKTTRNRYRDFEERLREMHPYDLPEIVALSPDAVLPAYAAWVIGETRRRSV
jgi:periplasmic divalent cation tolerance protein